ncbi:uncharacterized protein METZ01_LOCUS280723 [marine metagenome]|uniref:Uncharacterized protein n=1 Tax=marine metagenome TaxID=408172 RepID=A0A382KUA0_9ZZZZ
MLQFILETLGEAVIYGILYAITWIISRTLTAAGDTVQSVTDAAAKTSEDRPVIIFFLIFFLIISGFMAGAMISVIFPERIIKIGSITSISLLITPLIIGMITSFVGRCGKEQGRGPSIMATFLGGALFGLIAAVTRLLFIIQKQA